jgi:hypothetical protein
MSAELHHLEVTYTSVTSCSKVVKGSPDARLAKGDQPYYDNLQKA